MGVLDKAIKTCDKGEQAEAVFRKAKSLVSEVKSTLRPKSRKIDSNVFRHLDDVEEYLDYYIKNAPRGWYD